MSDRATATMLPVWAGVRATYLVLANSVLLLLILLISMHVALTKRYAREHDDFVARMPAFVREAYAHMTDDEVNDLLNATWKLEGGPFEYDAWFGTRERARRSRFINVDAGGFRLNAAGEAIELDGSVWVLGGSTIFGYGVADAETIPSVLQQRLAEPVVNLGRAGYYSAQENLLLHRLLETGSRPRIVVFLDGINERCDVVRYQDEMKALFERAQSPYPWSVQDLFGPILFVLRKMSDRAQSTGVDPLHRLECERFGKVLPLADVVRTTLKQRAATCTSLGLACRTFVQPFAGTHGVHRDKQALTSAHRRQLTAKYYHLESVWNAAGTTSVADALDGFASHAYVDAVHYSAGACNRIAARIADALIAAPATSISNDAS